jgi:hypothetical protein
MTSRHDDLSPALHNPEPADGRLDSVIGGIELEPRHSGRFLIGAVVTGLATILLTLVALRGLLTPPSGDLVASTAIGTSMSLAILLVGSFAILSLEFAHLMSRRLKHASPPPTAPGRGPGVAMKTPAGHAARLHHSARDRPGGRPWRHDPR